MSLKLLPFQRRFTKAVGDDRYLTCCLSGPRGLGKTTLGGWLCSRALTPGDELYAGDGKEIVLFSGSIEQCRLVYRATLSFLADRMDEYRLVDSATRVGITHRETRTRLKAIGSNPKTSLGLVHVPLVVLDEPAALHTVGGAALWDSIATAQGKVASRLKVVAIGTLAPASPGSWWHDLVERGTTGTTFVELLQGRRERWQQWREVLRVNPLARTHPEMAAKLREELEEAKRDSRLKARWLSYRLNIPSQDESTMLLDVGEWERACAREVGDRAGQPVVGCDLAGGRAWSAACALFPSGRVEALAVAPGVPSIEDQERRDRVPRGTYQMLVDNGSLTVAEGLRVPPPSALWAAVLARWGVPMLAIADRFRWGELVDVVGGSCPVEARVTRWSSAASDIRATRKMALDGPLSVDPDSRLLLSASLAQARVKSDDQGNTRLVKRDASHNAGRDDVAHALALACGAQTRIVPRPAGFFDGHDDPALLAEAEAAVAAERAMLAEIAA